MGEGYRAGIQGGQGAWGFCDSVGRPGEIRGEGGATLMGTTAK